MTVGPAQATGVVQIGIVVADAELAASRYRTLLGIDGWQVLEQLRSDPVTQNIPVLVATAHDSAVMKKKANAATAEAFVAKPFDLNVLREAIAGLLDR